MEDEYKTTCDYNCLGGFVNWGHLIAERAYNGEFHKDDIVSAPVYKVEEWGDGILFLQSYEAPFGIDTPKTKKKIQELCKYWNKKALR